MAVPAHDERDYEFAKKYNLPIERVVAASKEGQDDALPFTSYDGVAVNSPGIDGLKVEDGKKAMYKKLEEMGCGGATTTYRLRDWLISRQRYWGAPIQMCIRDRLLFRVHVDFHKVLQLFSCYNSKLSAGGANAGCILQYIPCVPVSLFHSRIKRCKDKLNAPPFVKAFS